ncbi:carboxylesterase/lipase family protein [Actinoplanes regularis]|uniref:carboxylesterase/lipase family protein n=1 Tax=Actinoplanes regularis TaxID=52697 RepID=UPI002556E4B1|nr:carboxylesterase family protein [Actinoplanes regularis]
MSSRELANSTTTLRPTKAYPGRILALAALAVCATVIAPPATASAAADPSIVTTETGTVQGVVAADRRTFSGIPYAAPPIGALRWKPPQPAPAWAGIRDAGEPGAPCAQPNVPSSSEDCLYLNVTTPPVSKGTRLPVLVWIHGGSLTTGAGSYYPATRLLAAGPILLVTVNYRLGALGFLAHPALDDGTAKSGAYGFADQTAALRWVRRNIAAFGGDPGNVTLAGESAGGGSTCAQLVSPAAAGLFQRAIIQSAPCVNATALPWWRPLAQSESLGLRAAATFGCADAPTAAACLRKVPVATLLAAATPSSQIAFPPGIGGDVLPEDPGVAVSSGRFNRVPVIHGGTRDEHRLFVALQELSSGRPMSADDYTTMLRTTFGTDSGAILARYPLSRFGSPSLAAATVLTDAGWSCPALRTEQAFAKWVPTFAYEFADANAPVFAGTESVSFPQAAYHAAELQYLFAGPVFPDVLSPQQTRLSQQMVRYWVRFTTTGTLAGAGSPAWPRFSPGSTQVLSLAPGAGGIQGADLSAEHNCAFWARYP